MAISVLDPVQEEEVRIGSVPEDFAERPANMLAPGSTLGRRRAEDLVGQGVELNAQPPPP